MKHIWLSLLMIAGIMATSGCDVDEGGPEELGENIEETYSDVGNKVEDACEDTKEKLGTEDTDC